jgi:LPPG:FO 2-phospho-L-lactate transferase
MLGAGYPLSAVTEALCARWQPGVRLLPATDDRLETHVEVADAVLHFQEWWVRYHAEQPAQRFVFVGAENAKPAAGVLDALGAADLVLLAPSNPVVSIAPILAVADLRSALVAGKAPVVGVSPIIGGAPVRGMADKCLATLGVPVTAAGVGELFGARGTGGVLDGWLVDSTDDGVALESVAVRSVPLWMTDEQATVAMVRAAVELSGVHQ